MSKRPALPVPTTAPLRRGQVPGGERALSDEVLEEVRRRLAGRRDPDPRLAACGKAQGVGQDGQRAAAERDTLEPVFDGG